MNNQKDKIKRFASGKFSFNDYLSVSSWFGNEHHHEKLKKILEEDWNETGDSGSDSERFPSLLDKLHHKINLIDQRKTRSLRNFYVLFSKIAAILIIPALITIIILARFHVPHGGQAESWAEIHCPVGTRTKFQLPDKTEGWLNSGSSIKYPVDFLNNRKIEILGEAWFDVVHLPSKEFRVITPHFDVKVLGTRFNVIAYDHEETAEVILEKGKVLVVGRDRDINDELEPDQHLVYNKVTKEVIKTPIDSKAYTSWKDGLLIFKNETMTEIARRLERKYDTKIILHGDTLKSSVFRATFKDESLDEICRLLSTVTPIRYNIHARRMQQDGSFEKGKVEMWLK